MGTGKYDRLMAHLAEAHAEHSPRSAALNEEAKRSFVDGGSHTLRLQQPFPPRIVQARGGWIRDEDGHDILDLWQGHLANLLGHNPEVVTRELARAFGSGFGLQSGLVDRLQSEVGEILCRRTGVELVRLTTSGTLANMSAVLLSCAFTGRDLVMKVGGGWHGAHPWALKGIAFQAEGGIGFDHVDSAGLSPAVTDQVIVSSFNDPERLREDFRKHGDRLACFVVEPMIGAGGLLPATREYLRMARELTHEYGALLVFDEVITGFRFRAGDLGALYGVRPDLAIFGKAIGGGMPVAAVGGRAEILALAGREKGRRVNFTGGTYCAHPASLLAAKTAMNQLVEKEDEIYPRLAELGESMRNTFETAFGEEGILVRCTGHDPETLPGSSLGFVHFPHEEGAVLDTPEAVADPSVCDVELSHRALGALLLIEGVHLVSGHGAVSTAHSEADMEVLARACRRAARRLAPYR
jgi:glutamate-1-semialdehyde 2,1-aminomutase